MNRQARHLESWLNELGTARSTGVLRQGGVTRSFPWQSSSTSIPAGVSSVARVTGWRRGLRGIAAAAVIGLVLVGVWRLERLLPTPAGSRTPESASLASRDSKNASAINGAETKVVLEGDYNRDGKVDGDDTQSFLNTSAQGTSGKGELRDASAFAAKLLSQ